MKWLDYREALGIGFSDTEKAGMLASKIRTFIRYGSLNEHYSDGDYYRFCLMTTLGYNEREESIDAVASVFKRNLTIPEMISYYIAFVNSQEECEENHKKDLIGVLEWFLSDLNIAYELFYDEEGFYIFPKGVEEFDNALVSEPLMWLAGYPSAKKAWSKALRAYSEATDENASEVADKFRKSLETFFKEFFGGDKSLENYKKDYGSYLKKQGIPAEISNNFETLHSQYTQYMNHYAKHRDATSDKVLEYLMYQTGNIMRLLITLKQEETTNAD